MAFAADWVRLQIEIRERLDSMGLRDDDVWYVRLDDLYWAAIEEFFALTEPPRVWKSRPPLVSADSPGSWRLPPKFRVVMRDHSWLEYQQFPEPFMNRWVVHESNRRPPRHYFSNIHNNNNNNNNNNNHNFGRGPPVARERNLADFVDAAMSKRAAPKINSD